MNSNQTTPMGIGARDITPVATGITPLAGASMKSGFGQTEMTVHAETHALASAAREEALVKAKIAVAIQRPRDWKRVEELILGDCARLEFAKEAIYRKPIGRGDDEEFLEGLSIRFAEVAIQRATNISVRSWVSSEDPLIRKITITVMDLESMVEYSDEISVEKTVMRQKLWSGAEVLAERENSRGQKTYIVKAGDDQLRNKENALKSLALRNSVLRLLPADIKSKAEALCYQTMKQSIGNDLGTYKKQTVARFEKYGATQRQLEVYIGKSLEEMMRDDLMVLYQLGTAIGQGETTWAVAFETKTGKSPDQVSAPDIENAPAASGEQVNQSTGEVSSSDDVEELLILIGEVTASKDAEAAKQLTLRANKVQGERRREVLSAVQAMNKAVRTQ